MNSTTTMIESWFIPFDILLILSCILVIIFSILGLFIIILDKTCHTIPMMLIANSCLSSLVYGCALLSLNIFTLENDFKQIQYEDSLCIFRGYLEYASCCILDYSYVLEALYRYVSVIYPHRLFWRSVRFQFLMISITWIFSFSLPIVFLFNSAIQYNVDNQICQIPLRLSFYMIYATIYIYVIPMSFIMFIYLKLVRYVKEISKRITPVNTLNRAQRELKMVQRTVLIVIILLTLGIPYVIFILMSFFTISPKYHYRIAFIFVDVSLVFVMVTLFKFTDPLKASIMKRIKPQPNRIMTIMT